MAFLVYRIGDRVLAEDLVADTFERALTARRRFDRSRGSEKTWLYSIALTGLRDPLRRAHVEERALERVRAGVGAAEPPPDDDVAERDRLHRAVARLCEEEREAIALRYGADLTLEDV